MESRWETRRCRPATPQSRYRSTRLPRNSAVRAASSATDWSEVPALTMPTKPSVCGTGFAMMRMRRASGCMSASGKARFR